MFQKIALFLLTIVSIEGNSQESIFIIELSCPLTIDSNFVNENYNGIIDDGLQFRFIELNTIYLGDLLHTRHLKNSKSDRIQALDVNLFIIQPRNFTELNLPSLPKFYSSLGVGNSVFVFNPFNNQPS